MRRQYQPDRPGSAGDLALGVGESIEQDHASVDALDVSFRPANLVAHRHSMFILAMVILGFLMAAVVNFLHRKAASSAHPAQAERSIAILPLRNLRQIPQDDFLGFSLADAVITRLGPVGSLSVRPSSAIEKYKVIAHRESEGRDLLRGLEKKIQQHGADPEGTYKIAEAYAVLGDNASALRMLRYSIENGFFSYPYFVTDPLLNRIRNEPQFSQLMDIARGRHAAFMSRFF